jgi:pyruvate kinase
VDYSSSKPASPPTRTDATLPVPATWISKLNLGDRIRFKDARGAGRDITVVDITNEGCWAESSKTAYIIPGISLTLRNSKRDDKDGTAVGNFPPVRGSIELVNGDLLILTRHLRPGRKATRDSAGSVLSPARIACTLPEIFDDVQTGEHVWFDDGKIGGIINQQAAWRD